MIGIVMGLGRCLRWKAPALIACGVATAVLVAAAWLAPATVRPVSVVAAQEQIDTRAFLTQHCLGCHTQQAKQRGTVPVALDDLNPSQRRS